MRNLSVALVFLVLLLTGCGGGGGGGGSSAPPEPSSSASNDTATVEEEGSVTINVTANDTRVDADTVALTSGPANGVVTLDGSEFTYSPELDFFGSDTFRYSVTGTDGRSLSATVTVTVNDVNDAPVATADSFTMVEDNTLPLTLAANDIDADDGIVSYEIVGSLPGVVSGSGTELAYTPVKDLTGEVAFQYRAVDSRGATSNLVDVVITVEPVTVTTLETRVLSIPASGYTSGNDAELDATVLRSAIQELVVPPNAISVLLSLTGADANIEDNGLFIASVTPPSGAFAVYQRQVHFCFASSCTSLVPRTPALQAESGTWTYQLGTLASSLEGIDLSGLTLTAAIRTGPDPDTAQAMPASLTLAPFLTSDSVSAADLAPVLTRIQEIAAGNQLELLLEPVTVISDAEYDTVSSSFSNATTNALVRQGQTFTVNVFFVEGFIEAGLAGISGGIPGSLGANDGNNGVLINATAFTDGTEEYFVSETAEAVFHETGHLLGLYHTTEARFSFNDVLDDTPNCEASVHDTNDDGTAGSTECPDAQNPMFWQNSVLTEWESLTDDQKHVLWYSPLAVPVSP